MAATSSPRKFPRGQPKSYSTCFLYNTKEALQKLKGLTFAACNPKLEKKVIEENTEEEKNQVEEPLSIKVSDTMLCSVCGTVFISRSDQKVHYKSDWHRYNIKLRLKGKPNVNEEAFDEISGNVSSISGSESDSDLDSDVNRTVTSAELKARPKPAGIPSHLTAAGNSSTDSESEGNQVEDTARRLPKVYFRTTEGELISLYRCVLCHKKWQPTKQTDLLSLAEELPEHMMWALFMAGGGHFAGAVFNKGNLVVHKTFHRYVVRAKRGTVQGSRDSQGGNAPKSAGASLRRYNEAALIQDIQDLILSWDEHIKQCDKIFLRAPSFNRKIFFGGKAPPFKKDDMRIRLIPFQTRRPTFNEVRRVYELLASVECYGDESEIQDFIPISPPQVFNAETGQLSVRDETQLSPRRQKFKNKLLSASPLVSQGQEAESELHASEGTRSELEIEESKGRVPQTDDSKRQEDPGPENLKLALPDHLLENQNSTGTSTASESELVEQLETISFLELKEFECTKKPKRRKKRMKRGKNSLRCQKSPESNIFEEEKFHLKNSLYTACKIGDTQSLYNLLAIFSVETQGQPQKETENIHETELKSCEKAEQSCDESNVSVINAFKNQGLDTIDLNVDGDNEDNKITESNTEALKPDNKSIQKKSFNSDSLIFSHESEVNGDNNSKSLCDSADFKEIVNQKPAFEIDPSPKIESDKNELLTKSEMLNENIPEDTTESILETSASIDLVKDKKIKDVSDLSDFNVKMHNSEGNKGSSLFQTTEIIEKDDNVKQSEKGFINSADGSLNEGTQTVDVGTATDPSLPLNIPARVWVTGDLPDLSPLVTLDILNETFGDNDTTLLHVAAREGNKDIIKVLMTAGANPALRDRAGLTPYMVSKDKPTRNEFRKFMGQWPDKFDYAQAQIPAPISEEQENERKRKEAERRKAQKKARQEKQKEKKAEEAVREAEEREKKRFLNLSDREKRALAAEKRLLDQASREGASKPVLSRCWQCGEDMTGKVPFEYMDYKFCTPKCLQQHRKQKS